MKPQITNITCPQCSTPLLAFEQTAPDHHVIHSYGCVIEASSPIAYAICPKCGGRAPFDRKLLPVQ